VKNDFRQGGRVPKSIGLMETDAPLTVTEAGRTSGKASSVAIHPGSVSKTPSACPKAAAFVEFKATSA
jgi:hypothetical protein